MAGSLGYLGAGGMDSARHCGPVEVVMSNPACQVVEDGCITAGADCRATAEALCQNLFEGPCVSLTVSNLSSLSLLVNSEIPN